MFQCLDLVIEHVFEGVVSTFSGILSFQGLSRDYSDKERLSNLVVFWLFFFVTSGWFFVLIPMQINCRQRGMNKGERWVNITLMMSCFLVFMIFLAFFGTNDFRGWFSFLAKYKFLYFCVCHLHLHRVSFMHYPISKIYSVQSMLPWQ